MDACVREVLFVMLVELLHDSLPMPQAILLAHRCLGVLRAVAAFQADLARGAPANDPEGPRHA
jgi:hypothetical protein